MERSGRTEQGPGRLGTLLTRTLLLRLLPAVVIAISGAPVALALGASGPDSPDRPGTGPERSEVGADTARFTDVSSTVPRAISAPTANM